MELLSEDDLTPLGVKATHGREWCTLRITAEGHRPYRSAYRDLVGKQMIRATTGVAARALGPRDVGAKTSTISAEDHVIISEHAGDTVIDALIQHGREAHAFFYHEAHGHAVPVPPPCPLGAWCWGLPPLGRAGGQMVLL